MPFPCRRALSWLRSQTTNVGVFGALGAILYLGHRFDWKFPRASAKPADAAPALKESLANMPEATAPPSAAFLQPGGTRIRFASPETLGKTNIQTRDVERMLFPEYIHANGNIDYVKTR